MAVSKNDFQDNWDRIFGMNKEITTHYSAEEMKRHATVNKAENGFTVDLYFECRLVNTVECENKSLCFANDVAENYCLGILT